MRPARPTLPHPRSQYALECLGGHHLCVSGSALPCPGRTLVRGAAGPARLVVTGRRQRGGHSTAPQGLGSKGHLHSHNQGHLQLLVSHQVPALPPAGPAPNPESDHTPTDPEASFEARLPWLPNRPPAPSLWGTTRKAGPHPHVSSPAGSKLLLKPRVPSWVRRPGSGAPAVSHPRSHCPQDPWDHRLAGARTPTPPRQTRKLRQDKHHHQPSGTWHVGPGCAGPGDVRGARARPRGRAGRRHPDLPPQLSWRLVFTLGSCPRFFYFLKPRTRSTFIIKTHKTRNLRPALRPGVGGCWSGSSLATRGSGKPLVRPCRSLCPVSSPARGGEQFPALPGRPGEKGPGSHEAGRGPLWVYSAAVRSLLAPVAPGAEIEWRSPRSRPRQDEDRQWLRTATPKLRPQRGGPAPREPEC